MMSGNKVFKKVHNDIILEQTTTRKVERTEILEIKEQLEQNIKILQEQLAEVTKDLTDFDKVK